MKNLYCLNELQQVLEVSAQKEGPTYLILSGELKGKRISEDFVYEDKDKAHQEIADRHTRLHKAFKNLDLVGCLSINKEPSRKLEGHSKKELDKLATNDKKSYKSWLSNLEKGWEEINHERPDLEKLSKTLRTANLIQQALENPLAIDFIEIMSKEARIHQAKNRKPQKPDNTPGNL